MKHQIKIPFSPKYSIGQLSFEDGRSKYDEDENEVWQIEKQNILFNLVFNVDEDGVTEAPHFEVEKFELVLVNYRFEHTAADHFQPSETEAIEIGREFISRYSHNVEICEDNLNDSVNGIANWFREGTEITIGSKKVLI